MSAADASALVACEAMCGRRVDVRERHVSIEQRFEVQDPPGHVVEIGGATGVVFHVECAPAAGRTPGIAAELRRLANSDELINLCDPYNGTTGDAVQEWLLNRAEEIEAEEPTSEPEWCVFYGGEHPDDAAGVRVTDELAEAEEDAQWIVESGIARRTVWRAPWEIQARCSSCGSVLDGGDDCCDGRLAEVEAGRADLLNAINAIADRGAGA